MTITINGDTGIAGVDGTASVPAVQGTDTNTGVFYPAADTVGVSTGGSERMRVDSSGNVGIGTSSPGSKLTVAGNVEVRSASGVYLGDSTNVSFPSLYSPAINNIAFRLNSGSETMRIDSSGNVGIGTSSPATKLHVSSTSDNIILSSGGTGFAGYLAVNGNGRSSLTGALKLISYSGGTAEINNASNAAMLFSTNDAERMRIDASGNIGVGTTSPSSRFNVIGDIHVGTSGNSARINNSGNDIVQFFGNRNGSSPYFYYNTSNSYGTTSDARSKNSITDISTSDALDYVMKLKPSSFKMNGNDKYQAGFIAQNCLEASQNDCQKSAVANYETYDEQDKDCPYLGVSDRPILAHAIAAIQELKNIIDSQAAEIAALKATR